MKRLLLLLLTALAIQTSTGQEHRKFSTFQLGFVPPLSTHGMDAPQYTNLVSFNILAGVSRNELGFSFSSLASIVRQNISGLHFSGIYNFVGNEGRGVLFGGVGNNVIGDYRGVQVGGIFNTTSNMSGIQFGGILNISHTLKGIQFAGLANRSDNMSGMQFAGILNIAAESKGVQCSGIANIAGNINGLQVGGIANVAGNVTGIQIGSICNKARNVRGMQIGLVNVARHNDCPVGLVNIIRNGEMAVGLNYNEHGILTATFRSGGKVMYGILGGGINPQDISAYVIEGGIGAHINCTDWFRINNELKAASYNDFSTESALTASYALLPVFRIAGVLELFGGPTLNFTTGNRNTATGLIPNNTIWKESTTGRASALYIGYTVGVQFVFHGSKRSGRV